MWEAHPCLNEDISLAHTRTLHVCVCEGWD